MTHEIPLGDVLREILEKAANCRLWRGTSQYAGNCVLHHEEVSSLVRGCC